MLALLLFLLLMSVIIVVCFRRTLDYKNRMFLTLKISQGESPLYLYRALPIVEGKAEP